MCEARPSVARNTARSCGQFCQDVPYAPPPSLRKQRLESFFVFVHRFLHFKSIDKRYWREEDCLIRPFRSPSGGHITPQMPPAWRQCPIQPHISLTRVAHIPCLIVPILPPIGIVPVVIRFLLVPFVRAVKLILHSDFPFYLLLASHPEILHAFFTIPNKGGYASAFAVPCSWGARPSPETRSS